MKLKDGSLDSDFRVVAFARATKDETWRQPWGEEVDVRNHYNELTMKLAQKKGLQRQLNIVFRVFDDGMGFRYVFPEQKQLRTLSSQMRLQNSALRVIQRHGHCLMMLVTMRDCGQRTT